jgi:hypothetical protein
VACRWKHRTTRPGACRTGRRRAWLPRLQPSSTTICTRRIRYSTPDACSTPAYHFAVSPKHQISLRNLAPIVRVWAVAFCGGTLRHTIDTHCASTRRHAPVHRSQPQGVV